MTFSHIWPFRKNMIGIPVFYRRHCSERFTLRCQQGNPQVIAEAFIYPYLITSLGPIFRSVNHQKSRVIRLAIMFNGVGTVAFTFQKRQPKLNTKRNRRRLNDTDACGASKSLPNVAAHQTIFPQQNCF